MRGGRTGAGHVDASKAGRLHEARGEPIVGARRHDDPRRLEHAAEPGGRAHLRLLRNHGLEGTSRPCRDVPERPGAWGLFEGPRSRPPCELFQTAAIIMISTRYLG